MASTDVAAGRCRWTESKLIGTRCLVRPGAPDPIAASARLVNQRRSCSTGRAPCRTSKIAVTIRRQAGAGSNSPATGSGDHAAPVTINRTPPAGADTCCIPMVWATGVSAWPSEVHGSGGWSAPGPAHRFDGGHREAGGIDTGGAVNVGLMMSTVRVCDCHDACADPSCGQLVSGAGPGTIQPLPLPRQDRPRVGVRRNAAVPSAVSVRRRRTAWQSRPAAARVQRTGRGVPPRRHRCGRCRAARRCRARDRRHTPSQSL